MSKPVRNIPIKSDNTITTPSSQYKGCYKGINMIYDFSAPIDNIYEK